MARSSNNRKFFGSDPDKFSELIYHGRDYMSTLKSSNHQSNLAKGLGELYDSQDLYDVTVVVGGKPFRAHKVVLAALSRYFKAMFTNPGFVDMKQSEIEIKEERFTSASFQLLLDYMYTGSVQMPSDDGLADMLQLALFLQIPGAVNLCVDALSVIMDSQEIQFDFVYYLWQVATQIGCDTLHLLAIRCIITNFMDFLKTDSSQVYELMSKDLLEELLKREDLNQSGPEDKILEVVVEWLQFDWDARKCNVESLLKNIRLGTIPDHMLKEILGGDMYNMAQNLLKEQMVAIDQAKATIDEAGKAKIKAKHFEFLKNVLHEMLPPDTEDPILTMADNVSASDFGDGPEMVLDTIKKKLEKDSYSSVQKCLLDFKKYFFYHDFVEASVGYDVWCESALKVDDIKRLFEGKLIEMPELQKEYESGLVITEKTLWTHRGAVSIDLDCLGIISFQIVKDGEERQGFRLASYRDIDLCSEICLMEEDVTADTHIKPQYIYPLERKNYGSYLEQQDSDGQGDGEGEDMDLKDKHKCKDTKYQMLTTLPRFLVAKRSQDIPGWRLAKYAEVKACYEMVKTYLRSNRRWYICRLDGGTIAGRGYDHEMTTDDNPGLGHKLLIKYPCSFSVFKCGQLLAGWSIATYEDVEQNLDLVKSVLSGKKADLECQVLGGKVCGLELERGMFMGLEYQIVVQKMH